MLPTALPSRPPANEMLKHDRTTPLGQAARHDAGETIGLTVETAYPMRDETRRKSGDGNDGDAVGNGLWHHSFLGNAEGPPSLGKIRMPRFNQNVQCRPTESAALSKSLI